ncbi:hypothetical protein [Sphingomonas sp.]|uniref:hypothetical protein n=1 Tax=Sphingomonas sp. TaxID=28214 RepID=UPI0025CF05DD|nr:hypothetical protein [Sphingomonas sp.]
MRSYLMPATGYVRSRPLAFTIIVALAVATLPRTASANNLNENRAWQFATASELAAKAALSDLIERKRGGAYATPSYTTNIDRQYVCSLSATATGNQGSQTALANSPSTTGATATATGNANAATIDGGTTGSSMGSAQHNLGAVSSTLAGSTRTSVTGTAWQALNSEQANEGDQQSRVENASACAFGVLN